jgi:hypothetical protein
VISLPVETHNVKYTRDVCEGDGTGKLVEEEHCVDQDRRQGQTLGASVAVHGLGGDESGERSVAQGVADPEHEAVTSQQ